MHEAMGRGRLYADHSKYVSTKNAKKWITLSKLEIVSEVLAGATDTAKIANTLNQKNILATDGLST